MIRIEIEMDKPKECHECPFQLKFKDDTVDDWYMRRCVIINQIIEYPLPSWCPIKEINQTYCADGERKGRDQTQTNAKNNALDVR
jgi:hypothetical protein